MAKKKPTAKTKKTVAPEMDPVMDGFRFELKRLLDNEFNPKTLNLVIQVATAARDILALRNPRLSGCRPGGAIGGYSGPYMGGGSTAAFNNPNNMYEDEPGETADATPPPPAAPWMDRETFGAKILREFITALPQIARASREDPAQLVKALSEARSAGLTDIAADLEERLRGNYITPTINAEAKAP